MEPVDSVQDTQEMTKLRTCIRWFAFGSLAAGMLLAATSCAPTKAGKEARAELRSRHNSNVAALAAQTANQDFRVGNLERGLNNIDQAIALEPQVDTHYVLRARILIEMNELQEARQALLAAQRLNPENPDAHYYEGLIYQRWSKREEAVKLYGRAHELSPTTEEYALAYVETLVSLKRLDEAQSFLEATRTEFEHEPAFRRVEGHIHLIRDKPHRAAEAFRQAMLLEPDDASIVESLVHAHIKARDYAKAQHYLERLLSNPKTSDRHDLKHLMARCLAASDRLVEAREVYHDLVEVDRSDPVVWYELGMVTLRIGNLRRVHEIARTLISSWPRRPEGFILRGRAHEMEDKLGAAIRDYRSAVANEPDREDVYLFLGMACEKRGNVDAARHAYEQVLAIDSTNRPASRLLAGLESRTAAAPTR